MPSHHIAMDSAPSAFAKLTLVIKSLTVHRVDNGDREYVVSNKRIFSIEVVLVGPAGREHAHIVVPVLAPRRAGAGQQVQPDQGGEGCGRAGTIASHAGSGRALAQWHAR